MGWALMGKYGLDSSVPVHVVWPLIIYKVERYICYPRTCPVRDLQNASRAADDVIATPISGKSHEAHPILYFLLVENVLAQFVMGNTYRVLLDV